MVEISSRPSSLWTIEVARVAHHAHRLRDAVDVAGVGDADELVARAGGVGERADEVEGGGHAELAPHRVRRASWRGGGAGANMKPMPQAAMQRLTCPGGRSMATPRASRTSGAAAPAGGRAVAVLGHRDAGGRGHERRRRRDVEGAGGVRRRCRRCRG